MGRIYDRVGSIGLAERERPAVVHHSVHETREAEYERQDLHAEFDVSDVMNPTSLRAPPPRSGYVQRWVADGTNPNADRSEARNWFAKHRAGWAARDPETVPRQLRHLYPSTKLHGENGSAIRIANQVLCEMPERLFAERQKAVRDIIDRQNSTMPQSMKELREKTPRGVQPLEVQDVTRSVRGRVAPSLSDVM